MYGAGKPAYPSTSAPPFGSPNPLQSPTEQRLRFGQATGGDVSVPTLRDGLFRQLYRLGRGMATPGEAMLRQRFDPFHEGVDTVGGSGVPVPTNGDGIAAGPGLEGGGNGNMGVPPVPSLPGQPPTPGPYAPRNPVMPPWLLQTQSPMGPGASMLKTPPVPGGVGRGVGGHPLAGALNRLRGPGDASPSHGSIGHARRSRVMPPTPDGRRRY